MGLDGVGVAAIFVDVGNVVDALDALQDRGNPFPEATLVPFFDGAIVMFILLVSFLVRRR